MIFIDTNVMMYAVGRPHPLQRQAHAFFDECQRNGTALFTSAEVLQELAHAYLPVNRKGLFDEAVAKFWKSLVWKYGRWKPTT